MYYRVENRLYGEYDSDNSRYPLVSLSKDAAGAVAVTDEGDGVAALPAGYLVLSLAEAVATFAVTASVAYAPPATITGFDDLTVYIDEPNKTFAPVIANPALGAWTQETSSDTGAATVGESAGTFTVTPVDVGETEISAKWTPTDTNFAAEVKSMKCTIAKRQIVITQVRDQQLTINTTKAIALANNVGAASAVVYTVLSSDTGICAVAETDGTLTLTPAASAPKGYATISVLAVDSNGKADDSEIMTFNVWVCASAVSITAISDQSVTADAEKEITVTCAGATIKEVTTSDATHFTTEITDKLKFKIAAVGEADDTATITVYCDKRGYGEDSEDFTATVV